MDGSRAPRAGTGHSLPTARNALVLIGILAPVGLTLGVLCGTRGARLARPEVGLRLPSSALGLPVVPALLS